MAKGGRVFLRGVGDCLRGTGAGMTGLDDVWDQRLRAARKKFGVSPDASPKHHHNYPLTSIADHLDAFAAAGITDVEIPWRAFYTCLFMGREAA
jgi:hypothetical protein